MEKYEKNINKVVMLLLMLATVWASPNIGLPIAIIALTCLHIFNKDSVNIEDKLKDELNDMRNKLSDLSVKTAVKVDNKEIKRWF